MVQGSEVVLRVFLHGLMMLVPVEGNVQSAEPEAVRVLLLDAKQADPSLPAHEPKVRWGNNGELTLQPSGFESISFEWIPADTPALGRRRGLQIDLDDSAKNGSLARIKRRYPGKMGPQGPSDFDWILKMGEVYPDSAVSDLGGMVKVRPACLKEPPQNSQCPEVAKSVILVDGTISTCQFVLDTRRENGTCIGLVPVVGFEAASCSDQNHSHQCRRAVAAVAVFEARAFSSEFKGVRIASSSGKFVDVVASYIEVVISNEPKPESFECGDLKKPADHFTALAKIMELSPSDKAANVIPKIDLNLPKEPLNASIPACSLPEVRGREAIHVFYQRSGQPSEGLDRLRIPDAQTICPIGAP